MSRTRFALPAALVAVAAWLALLPAPRDAAAASARPESAIKVTVPHEGTELKVNGKVVPGTGLVRNFKSGDLKAGDSNTFTFSAFWEPNNYTKITRTAKVTFKTGDPVVVDLSKADPKNPDAVVVRWVPTPQDIVDKMIDMAKVTKDDVVYEPGPGDARMLISAAKKGAKKCVGIEFDPLKTKEAQDNVKRAGVADRVTIRQGDALKVTDYGEATVILLYMGEQFNLALRPLFEKQCKPGTRLVSHRFLMGDWKPDTSITVKGADGDDYELHLWVIKEKKK